MITDLCSYLIINKDVIRLSLLDAVTVLLRRCGFELIETNEETRWLLLDLLPWDSPKPINVKIGINGKRFDNWRIHWASYIVPIYLAKHLKETSSLSVLPSALFEVIENVTLDKKQQEYVNNALRQFQMPYPIYKDLTNYGCNNRTCIVIRDGKKFLCKLFKGDRLHYLRNEVKVRDCLNGYVRFPLVEEVRGNYVLMEYIDGIKSISTKLNQFGYYPLMLLHDIFSVLYKLYCQGLVLLDFHPGNVILTEQNEIVFIDFEYVQWEETPKEDFFNSSYFVLPDKVICDGPLEEIGYEKFWKPYIQVEARMLLKPKWYLGIIDVILGVTNLASKYKDKINRRIRNEVLNNHYK